MKIVYITGCLGFMGAYFTRKCLKRGWMVFGIDKMTYASNPQLLQEFQKYENLLYEDNSIFIIGSPSKREEEVLSPLKFIANGFALADPGDLLMKILL